MKNEFENISWVLYPNDSTPAVRQLRSRQQYFFVTAPMQDLLARHLEENATLKNVADKVAIHLNDTDPAISVAELMRLRYDEHVTDWANAWAICKNTFSHQSHAHACGIEDAVGAVAAAGIAATFANHLPYQPSVFGLSRQAPAGRHGFHQPLVVD